MVTGKHSPRRTWIRSLVLSVLVLGALTGVIAAQSNPASEGKSIFDQKCVGCHTIGQGASVGPDLKGIGTQRDHNWLVTWITAPDKMIAAGDPAAVELSKQYPALVMPTLGLSEAEIDAVLAYIDAQSGGAATPAASPTAAAVGDVTLGKELFTGNSRFANGGPPCMACHSVSGVGALGGGKLGPDLTTSVTKYGGPAGLTAFLANPPTTTMNVVWSTQPLTTQEQADVVAFLDQAPLTGRPTNSIAQLLALAAAGAALLFLLAQIVWRRRLRGVRKPMVAAARQ